MTINTDLNKTVVAEAVNYTTNVKTHDLYGDLKVLTAPDGEMWFVGKEAAEMLGYTNLSDALVKHVEPDDKLQIAYRDLQNLGVECGTKGGLLVNEDGLFDLIMGSELPEAKRFQKWVKSVIREVRETGSYSMGQQPQLPNFTDPADAAEAWALEYRGKVEAQQLADSRAKEVNALTVENAKVRGNLSDAEYAKTQADNALMAQLHREGKIDPYLAANANLSPTEVAKSMKPMFGNAQRCSSHGVVYGLLQLRYIQKDSTGMYRHNPSMLNDGIGRVNRHGNIELANSTTVINKLKPFMVEYVNNSK